ncbi:MAG: ABC transporter permease [Candidatus Aminicenantes bacterium]|nr:ABC transporter permease [Candidatus Aminicenantes bacterium]
MLKNYFKITLRNISRNKMYSALNIVGLAIGLACCILILLYVHDELSYDRFHDNADSIYRVVPTIATSERTMYMAVNAHVQGPMLKNEFPEVLEYVRFSSYRERVIEYENISFSEERFLYADDSVFSVFSFDMILGNPKEALVNPNTIVLTEKMAEKYFGTDDPMGKSLKINYNALFTVTGVIKNIPSASHIKPDFLASFSSLGLEPSTNIAQDLLSSMNYYTYILLQEGTDYIEMEKKFTEGINRYVGAMLETLGGSIELGLQPLTKIYLHSDRELESEQMGDITYVWLFSGIGIFILLLACLNFMNLSTARSANRAKEVGLRKVVGANKSQLVRQFLGESMILTFISFISAIVLVLISMPFFRNISGKDILINSMTNPTILAGFVGLFLIIGLIGGSYPAFFLSAFRPVEVIQGKLKRGAKSSVLRIVLVSFQFAVSIILIIGTFTVNTQLKFVRSKNLGYDKDHVIVMQMRSTETQNKYEAIKEAIKRNPNVINVSASTTSPLGTSDFSVHHAVGKPEDELNMLWAQMVDENYIDTYKMEIVQGRNFSKDFTSDKNEAIIINEAAVKKIGWQNDPINKQLERFTSPTTKQTYTVVGVVKDYHFQSLHQQIEPMMLYYTSPYGNFSRLSVRVRPEDVQETISFLETTWEQFDTKYPFEYSFVDDQYDALYRTEVRLGKLFSYFTALAILIGCLGLFGLTSFTTEQRTKEIGIRKVLGASINGIIYMLVRDFTKWVFLAVIVAWPIGYLVMNKWLNNFAYRANLGVWIFLSSAFLALVISVVTVSYQSIKAALANPAKSIRTE